MHLDLLLSEKEKLQSYKLSYGRIKRHLESKKFTTDWVAIKQDLETFPMDLVEAITLKHSLIMFTESFNTWINSSDKSNLCSITNIKRFVDEQSRIKHELRQHGKELPYHDACALRKTFLEYQMKTKKALEDNNESYEDLLQRRFGRWIKKYPLDTVVLWECILHPNPHALLEQILFTREMEIVSPDQIESVRSSVSKKLSGWQLPFYFPCIPADQGCFSDDDIKLVSNFVSCNHDPNKLSSKCQLLYFCALVFLQLCSERKDTPFGFLVPSRNTLGQFDDPGCDFITVSASRLISMIELKDQKHTDEKKWNNKIRKLSKGVVPRVVLACEPNWTINIVLAGRNNSKFVE
jgi:hypothetical protein